MVGNDNPQGGTQMFDTLRSVAVAFAVALGLTASMPAAAQSPDTLAQIRQKGVMVVGVKNDYRPWGFLDPSGKIVGLEIDLAEEVARRIGVRLEMIPVTAANRMEFLNQGRIDMILATMGDTAERRRVIGMVEPNYYAGATNILAPKSANLKSWNDLRGRKVCGVQGAYYNRRVSQVYAPDLVVFPAVPDALNALLGGNCVAFLFDDTLITSTLSSGDARWANYEMPLASEDPQLWAIGVRQADMAAPFGQLMRQMSIEWHRTGRLLELERKWGIKNSPFLQEQNRTHRGS
jgi:polar amino acid transport system substrate-binding protein